MKFEGIKSEDVDEFLDGVAAVGGPKSNEDVQLMRMVKVGKQRAYLLLMEVYCQVQLELILCYYLFNCLLHLKNASRVPEKEKFR